MWKERLGQIIVSADCERRTAGPFDSYFNLRNHPWEGNRKMLNKWRRGRVRRSPISPPGRCSCLTGGEEGEGGVMVSPFSTRPPLAMRRSTAVLWGVECWVELLLRRQPESALSPSRPRPCSQCHCRTVVLARRVESWRLLTYRNPGLWFVPCTGFPQYRVSPRHLR